MIDQLQLGLATRRRVRLVRQTEASECGLAALAMVAGFYGLDIDLGVLRRRFSISSRGTTLKSLIAIADDLGFVARGVSVPLHGLSGLPLPAILHWNMNHFVVLEKVTATKALIHDPDGTSRWLTFDQLSKHFTGVALELQPAASFSPAQHRERLRIRELWTRTYGLKRALVQVLLLSAIMQVYIIAAPFYMQLAIDKAAVAQDLSLLTILALGFALLVALDVGATLLRSTVLMSAGAALGFGIAVNVARKMFRLPTAWFERRHVGDVLSRFQSVAPIQDALTQGAVAALIDGALVLLTLALMLQYSVLLTGIAVAAFLAICAVRLLTFHLERGTREAAIVASSKEQSVLIESIRGIVPLRLFGRESIRHSLWQGRLAELTNANVSYARIGIIQEVVVKAITGLEHVLSIWLAVRLVIGVDLTIGMIIAFMAYKVQFIGKLNLLVDQYVNFRMLGLHLERLSDIALSVEDPLLSSPSNLLSQKEFQGFIELRDVGFRYSSTEPEILKNVNLRIAPGDHLAITGPSGGGKSTLIKILLALVEPTSGEILIDGRPAGQQGGAVLRSQVAAVMQDDVLFSGSIVDNIAMFDDNPDLYAVQEAASNAAIHDEIAKMPMGYETIVGDMGSALSGGQKQRIILARALYKRPRVLVIDEGTSHLDPQRESEVNSAIRRMGITRVIVAHRLETVRSADRVFTLVDGNLRERPESGCSYQEAKQA